MTTLATTLGEQGRCLPALSRASESGTKLSPTPASQSHMRSLRPLIVVNQGRQTISGALVDRPIDTRFGSCNSHYVNPSTRGSPSMPKERRARSLTVSAVSLTFKVDAARRQRMLRTESAQDGRTKIARAQPRIRDGERTSSTLTDATSPSPTPSATRARPAPNMLDAAA